MHPIYLLFFFVPFLFEASIIAGFPFKQLKKTQDEELYGTLLFGLMSNLILSKMKTAGIILFILGIVGTVIFGIKAINDSDTFTLFGVDVAVSEANWTPLIFSLAVLIIGLFLTIATKKAARR